MDKGSVIITGAAGGIGKALVDTFAESGYEVIGIDFQTKEDGFREGVCYISCDLAKTVLDEEYASKIFIQVQSVLGELPLNALINNAAVQILGGTESLTRQDWQNTLDVNLIAPFIWSQALLAKLEKARGSIINISSIHARLTKKNFLAYATSKAALSGMTSAMAVDLGPRVRVNAIEPAAIETEMLKTSFKGQPKQYEQLKDCHPQRRIGQPVEIARLAKAIVEGRMWFLHGACIRFDGGIGGRLYDPE